MSKRNGEFPATLSSKSDHPALLAHRDAMLEFFIVFLSISGALLRISVLAIFDESKQQSPNAPLLTSRMKLHQKLRGDPQVRVSPYVVVWSPDCS